MKISKEARSNKQRVRLLDLHKDRSSISKYNEFGHKINHLLIYLRCEPDIAYQRMQVRNRKAEKEIPFEYLKKLHKYHDKWLMNKMSNILIIDANRDYVKNVNRFNEIYNDINKFIKF